MTVRIYSGSWGNDAAALKDKMKNSFWHKKKKEKKICWWKKREKLHKMSLCPREKGIREFFFQMGKGWKKKMNGEDGCRNFFIWIFLFLKNLPSSARKPMPNFYIKAQMLVVKRDVVTFLESPNLLSGRCRLLSKPNILPLPSRSVFSAPFRPVPFPFRLLSVPSPFRSVPFPFRPLSVPSPFRSVPFPFRPLSVPSPFRSVPFPFRPLSVSP